MIETSHIAEEATDRTPSPNDPEDYTLHQLLASSLKYSALPVPIQLGEPDKALQAVKPEHIETGQVITYLNVVGEFHFEVVEKTAEGKILIKLLYAPPRFNLYMKEFFGEAKQNIRTLSYGASLTEHLNLEGESRDVVRAKGMIVRTLAEFQKGAEHCKQIRAQKIADRLQEYRHITNGLETVDEARMLYLDWKKDQVNKILHEDACMGESFIAAEIESETLRRALLELALKRDQLMMEGETLVYGEALEEIDTTSLKKGNILFCSDETFQIGYLVSEVKDDGNVCLQAIGNRHEDEDGASEIMPYIIKLSSDLDIGQPEVFENINQLVVHRDLREFQEYKAMHSDITWGGFEDGAIVHTPNAQEYPSSMSFEQIIPHIAKKRIEYLIAKGMDPGIAKLWASNDVSKYKITGVRNGNWIVDIEEGLIIDRQNLNPIIQRVKDFKPLPFLDQIQEISTLIMELREVHDQVSSEDDFWDKNEALSSRFGEIDLMSVFSQIKLSCCRHNSLLFQILTDSLDIRSERIGGGCIVEMDNGMREEPEPHSWNLVFTPRLMVVDTAHPWKKGMKAIVYYDTQGNELYRVTKNGTIHLYQDQE